MDCNSMYLKRYDKLIFQLMGLTGFDVELSKDLRHDVYFKMDDAVKKGQQFDSEKGFVLWLHRIAFNLWIDWYRKRNKSIELRMNSEAPAILFVPSPEQNIEEEMIHQELVQQAINGVEQLHDNWKETYNLHVVDGLKFREIAQVTGRSQNCVLGEMRYSRMKLKKEIFNHG